MRTTPRKIECVSPEVAAILRQKTSAERFAMADDLWKMAREMVYRTLCREHSDWTEEQLNRETARRMSIRRDG